MSCDGRCGLRLDVDAEGVLTDGLSRRGFVERLTLAAIGAALVGCETGSPLAPDVPTGGPYTVSVADYPSLARVGGVAKVDLAGGGRVGVGRVGASAFAAYGLACTHQGTEVQVAGGGWVCPSHDARFDTAGNVTRGPATTALISLPTTFDAASGLLTINGSAAQGTAGSDDDPDDDD